MNVFDIDLKSGFIFINKCHVAPLGLPDFKRISEASGIGFEDVARNSDWPMYGAKVWIRDKEFWMNVSFFCENIESVWLSWCGGVVQAKGFNAEESDLIFDKNALSKFIKLVVGKCPDKKEYNHDVYLFEWGKISVSASLQSISVNVGISWKSVKRTV